MLYMISSSESIERQQAYELLQSVLQQPYLPFGSVWRFINDIAYISSYPPKQHILEMLLLLMKRPDFSSLQIIQLATTLHNYSSNDSEEQKIALDALLQAAQRSPKQSGRVLDVLNRFSAFDYAQQVLSHIIELNDLSVYEGLVRYKTLRRQTIWIEQRQQIVQNLFGLAQQETRSIDDLEKIVDLIEILSPAKLDEEIYKHLLEVLMRFAQRSDLSEKDQGHLAALLYRFRFSIKEQNTRHMLLEIIYMHDLSAEQLISIPVNAAYYSLR